MNSRVVGNAVIGGFGCIGAYILGLSIEKSAEEGLANAMSKQGSGSFHLEACGKSLENGLVAIAKAIDKSKE